MNGQPHKIYKQIMKFADSITKGFLKYGQPRGGSQTPAILDYQDPTYLGFQWRILSTTDFTKGSGGFDMDYYPQGLFLPDEDPDSAYSYFIRTSQTARAAMIKEFRQGFLDLLKQAPWYFTKVSGLEEIWKIDPKLSYRGKDKKLTFTTEEAIDLKMTYLMDLYRKAVFDAAWMRYALPENQRMFAMELVIAEIRPMQLSLKGWIDANTEGTFPGVILNDVGGLFNAVGGFAGRIGDPNSNLFLGNGGGGLAGQISGAAADAGASFALSSIAGKLGLRAPWSTTTFLSFRFDMCTFDPFSTSPQYLSDLGKTPEKKAENTVVVNTPYISEMNSYGLLGAVIKDSLYSGDYSANIKDLNQQPRTINDTLGGGNFRSAIGNAASNVADRLASKALGDNVYGFSSSSIKGAVGGFFNNPISTVGELFSNFTNRNAQASLVVENLGNIGLSGEDVQIIVESIGDAYTDSEISQNLVVNSLPRNILTGPDIVRARLGNAITQ